MSARAALLAHYDAHRRDLPWRRTRDPYAIWVSEIMLQQTRVETVIPYWTRWLERFPDPATLAAATEDEVLAAFSGLGYYRRARLLHRGVKEVVERYGGEVPEDREARLSLPGVGRYTAGAIGSIAFDREEPILDGNVMRVLARVHGVDTPLGRRDTEKALWAHAERWVEGPRPGDLNQALMELGATVCTPRNPACERCPLRRDCAAFATDRVDALPVPKPRKPPKPVAMVAVVASVGDRVALVRSEEELFGGLWGVPMREGAGRSTARAALREAGVSARVGPAFVAHLEHVLSHRRLGVEVWRATHARLADGAAARLVDPSGRAALGRSALTERILACGP